MTERDILFFAMMLIGVTTLVVFIVSFVRSRKNDDDEGPGEWWEGPWDNDQR